MRLIGIWIFAIALMEVSAIATEIHLIPKPNHLEVSSGEITLTWPIDPERVTYENVPDLSDEAYHLRIAESGVSIAASTEAGKFYAMQTLQQLVQSSPDGMVPCLEIRDAPRYAWRGFMLDESRHFFGKEKVHEILDYMARYKLNRFHWHLTDCNGWRIEIKKYPKLTTVGAMGNYTNPNDPARFYTQEEIKEIVHYAEERFITVVPEIDMPGHAAAAARAYPELSGGGTSKHPDFTFNPGSEQVYQFLTDVLTEVASLFPSQWIHYGGDEVHFASKRWSKLPEVKRLMESHDLKNLKEVEQYFNRCMADTIVSLGRKTAAWDEVVGANLDPESTLITWWRHKSTDALEEAFRKNYRVVLCPQIPCYFDFVQHDSHQVGRRIKKTDEFVSIEQTYAFPQDLALNESLVEGIQGNLWTERIKTNKRLEFMTYPRLLALAEAAWTQPENKNFDDFSDRLKATLPSLEKDGFYYFNPFDPGKHPEPIE